MESSFGQYISIVTCWNTLTYGRMVTSHIFCFVVNNIPFDVYCGAVAKQSTALETLMNGCMVETDNRVTNLDNVHEGIFICFLQFTYTDNCSAPLCLISNNHISNKEIHSDNPFDSRAVERKTTDL